MNTHNLAVFTSLIGFAALSACAARAPQTETAPQNQLSGESQAASGFPSESKDNTSTTEGAKEERDSQISPGAATAQNGATDAQHAPSPPAKPRCPDGTMLVPGGTYKTAVNRREVSTNDLCVDTFETTAAQYKECVEAGKCTTNQVLCSEQSTWGKSDKQNHPMVCVDFSQAEDYCEFRGKRLPETSEWEWVARGGEAARKYPWGDEDPDQQLCWRGKQPLSGTCEVGSFPEGVSAHGIHDLSGSVHEFTTTAQDATGIIRIARGGSWKEGDPHMMWPGRIGGFETSYRCGFLGIRCVTEAAPNSGVSEPDEIAASTSKSSP